MEVSGRIKKIFDEQTFGSGFKKREVVITTQEQYPQHLAIEFYQDKTPLLDDFQIGDEVKISINLRGREWTNPEGVTKYFNSINGWRIEKVSAEAPGAPAELPPAAPMEAYQDMNQTEEEDDLPF